MKTPLRRRLRPCYMAVTLRCYLEVIQEWWSLPAEWQYRAIWHFIRFILLKRRSDHLQRYVWHRGRRITVDRKLAALLTAVWQQGIETMFSCWRHAPGEAYIKFRTPSDTQAFITLSPDLRGWYVQERANMVRFPQECVPGLAASLSEGRG